MPLPVPLHFQLQPARALNQFVGGKRFRRCRGALDQVAKAISQIQEFAFFRWRQLPACEAGCVQGGPKAVAGPGKVMPHRCGVQPGVDATE